MKKGKVYPKRIIIESFSRVLIYLNSCEDVYTRYFVIKPGLPDLMIKLNRVIITGNFKITSINFPCICVFPKLINAVRILQ